MEEFIKVMMRRNVVKVAVVYLIAGCLTMQVAAASRPLALPAKTEIGVFRNGAPGTKG